jgi:hypothetical protein
MAEFVLLEKIDKAEVNIWKMSLKVTVTEQELKTALLSYNAIQKNKLSNL